MKSSQTEQKIKPNVVIFTVLETVSDRYSIVCQKVITVSLAYKTVIAAKEKDEKTNSKGRQEKKGKIGDFDDLCIKVKK